jgi:hypothetical protein
MRNSSILAAFLVLVVTATGSAQSVVRPGVRVRIDAPGITAGPTVATIISAGQDSVVIAGPDLAPLAVSRAAIGTIEVSHGRDRWLGAKHGTVVGVEWGLGTGLLLAAVAKDCTGFGSNRSCHSLKGDEQAAVVGMVTYAGAFYGAIIGAIAAREHWEPIQLASRASISLRDGRPALSWSQSF